MSKKVEFYCSLLTPKGKKLYRSILDSARRGLSSAEVKDLWIPDDEVPKVVKAFQNDWPEYFYIPFSGKGCLYYQYSNGDYRLEFKTLPSPEERERQVGICQRFLRYIVGHMPKEKRRSQYEMCLWLHDTLTRNVRYNYDVLTDPENCPDAYTVYGIINSKSAVCSGISKMFQMLCETVGIWCIYVTGNSLDEQGVPGERYAWNMVCIDGVYAYLDVTWDLNLREDKEDAKCPHDYFCLGDSQFFRSHRPETAGLPHCSEKQPLNYFVRNGCYFTNARDLQKYLRAALAKKEKQITFRLDPGRTDWDVLRERLLAWVGTLSGWRSYTYTANPSTHVITFDFVYPE